MHAKQTPASTADSRQQALDTQYRLQQARELYRRKIGVTAAATTPVTAPAPAPAKEARSVPADRLSAANRA